MNDSTDIMRSTLNAQRSTLNAQRHNYFLKFLAIIFKMIISIILSLIIITPIAKVFIDTAGPNAVEDVDGATDLRLPPFADFANLREGFSRGKFNNEGYNSLFNYKKGMLLNVLLMGSSNMQAGNVMPKYNTANVLMDISGKKVYNIGIGSHNFLVCANNLAAALKKYKPHEYVVIEAMHVSFSEQELLEVLSSDVPKVIANSSLAGNVGMLRSLYRKYIRNSLQDISKSFVSLYFMKNNVFFSIQNYIGIPTTSPVTYTDPVLLNEVLKRMAETVKNSGAGAKLIIAYHTPVALNKDGSLKIEADPEDVKIFSDACKANGIYFIDMSQRFLDEYQKNYTLPTGFFNTSVASGHMNKDGHRMFAEEIYKLMQKIEGVNN